MTNSNLEPWLIDSVNERVAAFTAQLRGTTDTSVKVPNLDWTVADLGQHVAGLPWHFRDLDTAGAGYQPPTDWTDFSDSRRRDAVLAAGTLTEMFEADELADTIDAEFAAWLTELHEGPAQRWLYAVEVAPTTIASMMLNEAAMHGLDLAGVTGAPVPKLNQQEAAAALDATMKITHVFVDAEKAAAQPDGVYHIKVRGGKDYTWTKTGSELIVTEGKPAKVDAHLNTDPAMFMLSSLGRVSQLKAGLSGKMVSYGRKPWRFLGLGNIVADGV